MSEKRREIKVPPAQILREFRMRYLPIGVFAAAAMAAFMLWERTVIGPTFVGEVEAVQAMVVSPEAGIVTNLLVKPYQLVKAGDTLVEIVSTDARRQSSQVQDFRSSISMAQLELGSMIDHERIAFDFQALSMNTLRFRADLAAARSEVPTLEAALRRAEQGWNEKVVPFNDYELALRTRDSVKARVAELEKLVAESEARLKEAARTAGAFTNFASAESLPEAVKRLSAKREGVDITRLAPIKVVSPIDGTVGFISKRPGENVLAGDPVVTIHSLQGERIVVYLRQGVAVTPKKGMPVTVRCRTLAREEAVAKIEDVSYRYEAITNQALLRPGLLFELGRPISIDMPDSLRSVLLPGELVDLVIKN